jgi:hypothetical protein
LVDFCYLLLVLAQEQHPQMKEKEDLGLVLLKEIKQLGGAEF